MSSRLANRLEDRSFFSPVVAESQFGSQRAGEALGIGHLAVRVDLYHGRIFEVSPCDDFGDLGAPVRTHLSACDVQVGGVGVLEEDKYPDIKRERGVIRAAFELLMGRSVEFLEVWGHLFSGVAAVIYGHESGQMVFCLRVYDRFQRTDIVVVVATLSGLLGPHRILCNVSHHSAIKSAKRILDLSRSAQTLSCNSQPLANFNPRRRTARSHKKNTTYSGKAAIITT